MSYEIGIRAGALLKTETDKAAPENSTVWLFGYGVYLGYRVPDPALGIRILGTPMDRENPCIKLDSGKLVFGCECWWGPEDKIKEMVGKFHNVIDVDIDEARREYAGASA